MVNDYYQVELDKESQAKTTFMTRYRLFEHTHIGFDLCNAPATSMWAMMLVLRGLIWREVLAYLDDIIVLGHSFEDHLQSLKKVFECLRAFNLKITPRKCFFPN